MIKNIMVCLDLTEMDGPLLRYTRHLCQVLGTVEKAYLVHNIKFEYPEDAQALMEELERPLPELIREAIGMKAEDHFESESKPIAWEAVVTDEQSTAQAMARFSNEKGIELVAFGKKISYQGSGLVAEKILRLSDFKARLLLVPETAPHRIQRLLSPTDFSKPSVEALRIAHKIATTSGGRLMMQHVYSIPMHYFPYIPVQGFRKSIEEEARKQFRKFRESLPEELQDTPCEFTYSKERTVAQTIYDLAIQENKDLIVIGSKGRSGVPAILLGSVAIQVLKFDFHVPLLIVR